MAVEFIVPDRLIWTVIDINNPPGPSPLPYRRIYIQANSNLAREIFRKRFAGDGVYPEQTTCSCCGPDFQFLEQDGHLKDVTEYDRGYDSMADFFKRDDILVIYTRDRGEEL